MASKLISFKREEGGRIFSLFFFSLFFFSLLFSFLFFFFFFYFFLFSLPSLLPAAGSSFLPRSSATLLPSIGMSAPDHRRQQRRTNAMTMLASSLDGTTLNRNPTLKHCQRLHQTRQRPRLMITNPTTASVLA